MPLVLEKEQKSAVKKQGAPIPVVHIHTYEAVAMCPKCKAFQTISFVDGKLVETRKFSQTEGQIFHDCGSNDPCRMYRGL